MRCRSQIHEAQAATTAVWTREVGIGVWNRGAAPQRVTRWVSARAPCGARPSGTPAWARERCAAEGSRMVSGIRLEPASRRRASETANVI